MPSDHKIKVLVVDDSAFMRHLIQDMLRDHTEIEVVDSVSDGLIALRRIRSLRPDVVTLDVEMPHLNGIETLKRINEECPTPVIMMSAFTQKETETTIRALQLGAIDFLQKPSLATQNINTEHLKSELCKKIIMAARLRRHQRQIKPNRPLTSLQSSPTDLLALKTTAIKAIVIGSSTGGPKALQEVLPALPKELPVPVLVVQHMPPGFTASLAMRLNSSGGMPVKEAKHGDPLEPGVVFMAPGDYHMEIDSYNAIRLHQAPPQCSVRPSADVTLASAARHFSGKVLGVILTGMGFDGMEGISTLKKLGGKCIAEDESTCVVYGMPKAVIERHLADVVVPLPQIANEIMRQLLRWQV